MRKSLLTIAYYTLLEAARNRLIYVAGFILAIGFAFAIFLKQVSITESGDIQLAFLAALFRLAAVFIAASFVIVSQVREANDKVMEWLLTRDLSRAQYLFGKMFGYLGVALALAILFTAPLCFFAAPSRAAMWGLGHHHIVFISLRPSNAFNHS